MTARISVSSRVIKALFWRLAGEGTTRPFIPAAQTCPSPYGLPKVASGTVLASSSYLSGNSLRKLRGHTNFVNAIAASRSGGQEMIASVSDDNTCRVWDPREKNAISVIENQYQLTAVTWAASSPTVFTGGIDNTIRVCL